MHINFKYKIELETNVKAEKKRSQDFKCKVAELEEYIEKFKKDRINEISEIDVFIYNI